MYGWKMRGYVAPVSVVAASQAWPYIVLGSAYTFRNERISPVGADYDPRFLAYIRSGLAVASNPGDTLTGISQFCDGEGLSDFRTGFCGGVQQQLVQQQAAWGANLGDPVRGRQIARQSQLA